MRFGVGILRKTLRGEENFERFFTRRRHWRETVVLDAGSNDDEERKGEISSVRDDVVRGCERVERRFEMVASVVGVRVRREGRRREAVEVFR